MRIQTVISGFFFKCMGKLVLCHYESQGRDLSMGRWYKKQETSILYLKTKKYPVQKNGGGCGDGAAREAKLKNVPAQCS